jgi:murein L,D-transpeptidase YafK
MAKYFLISFFLLSSAFAEDAIKLIPSPILMLDNFYTHHVLVAEKSTHLLYLFKNVAGVPELVKSIPIATGKKTGDKTLEGDFKTPEGIFHFTSFMTNKQLIEKSGSQGVIYGAGAFITDFPNPVDARKGKTGSGIWLHSTNDETRIDKGLDSKGCVVTANNDLIDLAKYIELYKTPLVIVQDLVYLNEKTHMALKNAVRQSLENWLNAWRNKDIENYMTFYHTQEFMDPKGNYAKYKAYKKAVFSMPGKNKIELDNIAILQSKDYAIVTFTQKYQSNVVNDTGRKILYLKQDSSYNWKIVNEVWSKNGLEGNDQMAFTPSMRFFKEGMEKGNN